MGVCTIMYKIGSSTTTTSQAKFAEKIVTVAAHLRPHGTAPSPHANRGGLAQWLLPLWLLLRLVLLLVLLLLQRLYHVLLLLLLLLLLLCVPTRLERVVRVRHASSPMRHAHRIALSQGPLPHRPIR